MAWNVKKREEREGRVLEQAQNWKGASRKPCMKFQLAGVDWSQLCYQSGGGEGMGVLEGAGGSLSQEIPFLLDVDPT